MKRFFDLFVSALALILLAPAGLLLYLWVRLSSQGPGFYRQTRIGRFGRPFAIFKFRTMVVNADQVGGNLTIGRDPRVTQVGHFLRKYKLDELPQLINVFLGEMSFVGPRPEVKKYVDLYTPAQRQILNVRPGITDVASIIYRNESELLKKALDPEVFYIREVMPRKLKLNSSYLKKAGLRYDLGLVLKTMGKVWSRK